MSDAAPRDLVIVGDSLFAEIAHEYFEHDSRHQVVAFSVEREHLKQASFRGLPVVPFEDLASSLEPAAHSVFVAITYRQLNRVRTRLLDAAVAQGFSPASYISSRAFVWPNAILGEHCFVFEDNTIQPFVTIGRNCVLWSGNHIGHHSSLGDNIFIVLARRRSRARCASATIASSESTATIVNDVAIGSRLLDRAVGHDHPRRRAQTPSGVHRGASAGRSGPEMRSRSRSDDRVAQARPGLLRER